MASFNPRPRVEGDRPATQQEIKLCCFNPRPRVEGDLQFATNDT